LARSIACCHFWIYLHKMEAQPQKESWADQVDSDEEMEVECPEPTSGAMVRSTSRDSNCTHMSWDDSNCMKLLQHYEHNVHSSPRMQQAPPAACLPQMPPCHASGALERSRSVDSNCTHVSWDDSNFAQLMQHYEKSNDSLNQSAAMPAAMPAESVRQMPLCPGEPVPMLAFVPVAGAQGSVFSCEPGQGLAGMQQFDSDVLAQRRGRRRSPKRVIRSKAFTKPLRKKHSSTLRDLKETASHRSRPEFEAMENDENQEPCNASSLPEASEEDWQRRVQKRHAIVAHIKGTAEYKSCSAMQRASRPITPDPYDRSVSKRQWEGIIVNWRNSLRQRCTGVSTKEL